MNSATTPSQQSPKALRSPQLCDMAPPCRTPRHRKSEPGVRKCDRATRDSTKPGRQHTVRDRSIMGETVARGADPLHDTTPPPMERCPAKQPLANHLAQVHVRRQANRPWSARRGSRTRRLMEARPPSTRLGTRQQRQPSALAVKHAQHLTHQPVLCARQPSQRDTSCPRMPPMTSRQARCTPSHPPISRTSCSKSVGARAVVHIGPSTKEQDRRARV